MKYRDVTSGYLESLGFEQVNYHQEPNIKDIAYGMSIGMYEVKVELDENHIYLGDEYTNSGLPGYGSTYQDRYRREYLYYRIRPSYAEKHFNDVKNVNLGWVKGLYRDKYLDTRLVSNYCGD
jgi:hypothetical protein